MTPLHEYMHLLLGDDDALRRLLAAPIEECEKHRLSKAERSVVRRVLTSASTDSTNGYAIVRPLNAYRMAIRMLQNVMHRNMGAAIAAGSSASNTLFLYYGPSASAPATSPYNAVKIFTGTGNNIGDLMSNIRSSGQSLDYADSTIPYKDQPDPIIGSFTIDGVVYNAPPPPTLFGSQAFWFYSVNGYPGPTTSGGAGFSYTKYKINPGDVVYWQVIAPSPSRGFQPCYPTTSNHAETLA